MYEIKFENLKLKAKREYASVVERVSTVPGSEAAARVLLAFVTLHQEERESLRAFAQEFHGKSWDYLASRAKEDNRFAEMLLKVREDGISIIDRWDVRSVKKLINAFPNVVPARYRDVKIQADLVDNDAGDDCDWVVFFGNPGEIAA